VRICARRGALFGLNPPLRYQKQGFGPPGGKSTKKFAKKVEFSEIRQFGKHPVNSFRAK
jgi:hypothetical protein